MLFIDLYILLGEGEGGWLPKIETGGSLGRTQDSSAGDGETEESG